jgi:hypothetical protein
MGSDMGLWAAPLVAFAISTVTSMGGVSGAFLLLPFQVSVLGITSPSVSATNHLFNVVAIPSGVVRYIREGRMLWPLVTAVVAGTLPGVLIGTIVRVVYLPDPTTFKIFVGCVLAWIGIRLLRDVVRPAAATRVSDTAERRFRGAEAAPLGGAPTAVAVGPRSVTVVRRDARRLTFEFGGERFAVSVPTVIGVSLAVGVVGGVYGIGGGAIIAPFLVSVLGLPVSTVAGAALTGTLCTSLAGVAFYQLLAPVFPQHAVAPDWVLGLAFGAGGAVGMYCGARLQRHVPARVIKTVLAAAVLFVAVRYLAGLALLV